MISPNTPDPQRVSAGLSALLERADDERHQRDVGDAVLATTSQNRLVDHFGMSTAVAPTPSTENIVQLWALTWKNGR